MMKKFTSILFSTLALSTLASADDLYWGANSGTWWSSSWAVNWETADKTAATRAPNSTDNAIFDYNFQTYKIGADLTKNTVIYNAIFQNSYTTDTEGVKTAVDFALRAQDNTSPTLTILGNIIKYRSESDGGTRIESNGNDNRLSLNVSGTVGDTSTGNIILGQSTDPTTGYKGSLYLGGDNSYYNLQSLFVTGSIQLNKVCTMTLNVGTGTGTLDNPDVIIAGPVEFKGSGGNNPTFVFNNQCDKVATDKVLSIGGMYGNGNAYIGANAYGTTTIKFTNAAGTDYNYYGYFNRGNNSSTNTQLKIVMNGEGTQTLATTWETDKQFNADGVEVISGNLKTFSYLSMGDITMRGGKLTIIGLSCHYSTETGTTWKAPQFHGNSLSWNAGTIEIMVYGSGDVSKIILDGSLTKGEDYADGNAIFKFSGSKALDFMLDQWVQIMSFDSTDMVASDFEAEDLNGYTAQFKIENNKLYAMYTSVPEPAAISSILGIVAMLIWSIKRRK